MRSAVFALAFLAGTSLGFSPAAASIPETPPDEADTSQKVRIPTSTSSTTSSTHPFEVSFYFQVGVYPTIPLETLRLRVSWGSSYADGMNCDPVAIPGAAEPTLTEVSHDTIEALFDFGSVGLQQSQRLLDCHTYVWHAEASWEPVVEIVEARGLDHEPANIVGQICVDCGYSRPRYYAPPDSDYDTCRANICGDVVVDGVLNSSDALALLRRAVGENPKYIERYDVNRSGDITALDSLSVLRRAVGLSSPLYCAKPPGVNCAFGPPAVSTTLAPE